MDAEAALAVRDVAFGELGLTRLIALADAPNAASIRGAEKLGMRYEKDATLLGYTRPDRVYSLTRQA
ncbi:MAG: GNAT family N-acetyltransferase [Planctomycetes bacterium]|nr:GNAT family N-acetyltransferase [Planctomycetota bacterium]